MATDRAEPRTFSIGQDTLLEYIRALMFESGGRGDEQRPPNSSGPWDSVARYALASSVTFGPDPEQWRLTSLRFRAGPHGTTQPALRRFAFCIAFARAVISRTELFAEIADFSGPQNLRHVTLLVGEYVGRFVDDCCTPGFRLRYPFRGPRPGWYRETLDGVALATMGSEFTQGAKLTASPALRRTFADAGMRLSIAGRAKLFAAGRSAAKVEPQDPPSRHPYVPNPPSDL